MFPAGHSRVPEENQGIFSLGDLSSMYYNKRMDSSLFHPRPVDLPTNNLVIIPWHPDSGSLQGGLIRERRLLRARLLFYSHHAVLTGFTGYSHLYLLLPALKSLNRKKIVFLGTAGSLVASDTTCHAFFIEKVVPSGLFTFFPSLGPLSLSPFLPMDKQIVLPGATAVSVDIIQRETPRWVRDQVREKRHCVEMELYPLRHFLGPSLSAVLVTSDRVTENGIHRFPREQVANLFGKVYQTIVGRFSP